MKYYERLLLEEIKKYMERREIIAIKGPRQSGKTTLLKMLKDFLLKKGVEEKNIIYLSFEDIETLEKFSLSPKEFIKSFIENENERYYFLIDEAQYCKELGKKLKLLYDSYENAKFIITGSSSLELTSETAKFLVGRLFSFELLPFNFFEFLNAKDKRIARIFAEKNEKIKQLILNEKDFEIPKEDIFVNEILRYFEKYVVFGGYPEVIKARKEEEKKIILKNIFNTYLEKDILSYLQITDVVKFKKLVSILSYLSGDLISFEKLTTETQSYFKEINFLLDVLQQTYVIKLLRPFHKNLITELKKNPKVYFFDFGLRNYAINNFNNLEIRSDSGKLVENFVLNEISAIVGEKMFLNYWRTIAKAEVDFVLSDGNKILPIEVKFESFKKEKIGKSLYSFIKNYSPKFAIVATKDFWGEKQVENTKVKFIPSCYL
jgi:predicted AAA+ superfamily ATPase